MLARRLTVVLFALTFILLLAGGVVHSTGSSLACPDWPLCYGQVMPPMHGGIFYEHSHRLIASSVGLITLLVAGLVWPLGGRQVRLLASLGVALVLFQGCLGGLTVLLRLPPLVSIAHLATSMAFFAWTIVMMLTLRAHGLPAARPWVRRTGVAMAAAAVYMQIVLGAIVRHQGASMTCGREALLCAGSMWPNTDLQWLQTSHRVLALWVAALVIVATLGPIKAARRSGRTATRRLGVAIHAILLLQLVMGVLTLKTGVHLHVVTTHLALGALLWAALVAFYLLLGPLGVSASAAAAAPGPAIREPRGVS